MRGLAGISALLVAVFCTGCPRQPGGASPAPQVISGPFIGLPGAQPLKTIQLFDYKSSTFQDWGWNAAGTNGSTGHPDGMCLYYSTAMWYYYLAKNDPGYLAGHEDPSQPWQSVGPAQILQESIQITPILPGEALPEKIEEADPCNMVLDSSVDDGGTCTDALGRSGPHFNSWVPKAIPGAMEFATSPSNSPGWIYANVSGKGAGLPGTAQPVMIGVAGDDPLNAAPEINHAVLVTGIQLDSDHLPVRIEVADPDNPPAEGWQDPNNQDYSYSDDIPAGLRLVVSTPVLAPAPGPSDPAFSVWKAWISPTGRPAEIAAMVHP